MKALLFLLAGGLPLALAAEPAPVQPNTNQPDLRRFQEQNDAIMEQNRAEAIRKARGDEVPSHEEKVKMNKLLKEGAPRKAKQK